MQITRFAIEIFTELSIKNIAWSDSVCIPVIALSVNENTVLRVTRNYDVIIYTYRSVCETFQNLRLTYSTFSSLYMVGMVLWYPTRIILITPDENKVKIFLFTVACFAIILVSVFKYNTTTLELKNLEHKIEWLHYKKKLRYATNRTRILFYESAHIEKAFDCGLFALNFECFPILYNFITLSFPWHSYLTECVSINNEYVRIL